jgi:hypothetical protein
MTKLAEALAVDALLERKEKNASLGTVKTPTFNNK